MSKTIPELFREVILLNELGGDLNEALRFSDPDGVRSGKSGWSFGVCQFDTRNNEQALACLRDCGFRDGEIKDIVNQSVDVSVFNKRLQDHAGVVIEYDLRQLQHCINQALAFASKYEIPIAETAALLALADTVNQYGSLGAATAKRLTDLERPITAADILAVKLTWKYARLGDRQRRDTIRRHENILAVVAGAA